MEFKKALRVSEIIAEIDLLSEQTHKFRAVDEATEVYFRWQCGEVLIDDPKLSKELSKVCRKYMMDKEESLIAEIEEEF